MVQELVGEWEGEGGIGFLEVRLGELAPCFVEAGFDAYNSPCCMCNEINDITCSTMVTNILTMNKSLIHLLVRELLPIIIHLTSF